MEPNPKKLFQLALCVLFLFALLFIGYLSFVAIAGEEGKLLIESGWVSFKNFVLQNGFWLFCSIAILPGFILPVAPLLTLAGYWGGEHGPWLACLNCVLALAVNLCWTYWFARKPGRSLIKVILSRTKFNVPEKPPENLFQWAFVLRLTPGVPFIFTNYILAFLKMPFGSYLVLSVPILSVTACGYVLIFAGFFGGEQVEESAERWAYALGGVALVVAMTLLGRRLTGKNKHAD